MKRKIIAVSILSAFFAIPAAYAQEANPNAGTNPNVQNNPSALERATPGNAPQRAEAKVKDTAHRAGTAVKDSVITGKIKASMAKDRQVSAMNVKVDTDNAGVVQLSGTAKTQAEADRAVSIARATDGVTNVRSDIRIVPESAARTAAKTSAVRSGPPNNATPNSGSPTAN